MNLKFRLTFFLIFTCFAGLTVARGAGDQLDMADFARNPESFAGRVVEVQARVIAIDANGQSLVLFDSPSHTRISVRLTQLPQTERTALIGSDVRQVAVRGRASVVAGRLTIVAQSVQAVLLDSEPAR